MGVPDTVPEAVEVAPKKKRNRLPAAAPSTPKPSKKPRINPVKLPDLPTAADLFGSDDSEDEQQPITSSAPRRGKKTPIYSYISSRIANGYSRQAHSAKTGSHYVEVKVYKCDDIDKVLPINRWQHSVITVKNQTNADTEAWAHLTKFISATRKEFREIPKTFISNNYF